MIAQTFEDWKLIIAADGSYPDVEKLDERIHVLSFIWLNVVCRFAHTINNAVRQYAGGEFITYLCHDDLYLPWRLELMMMAFEQNPSWDVVFGRQQLITELEGKTYLSHVRDGDEKQPAGTVDHSSVMHRRECFEKAGGWDEAAPMRYGDAHFWKRLIAAGYQFHHIPEILDVHRFNNQSVTYKIDHPEEGVTA